MSTLSLYSIFHLLQLLYIIMPWALFCLYWHALFSEKRLLITLFTKVSPGHSATSPSLYPLTYFRICNHLTHLCICLLCFSPHQNMFYYSMGTLLSCSFLYTKCLKFYPVWHPSLFLLLEWLVHLPFSIYMSYIFFISLSLPYYLLFS